MKLIDLSVEVYDGLQTHTVHPKTLMMDFVTHAGSAVKYKKPCVGYATKLLIISDHLGTHVDAPVHFVPGKDTIESTQLEKLIGEAVVIDVSGKPLDRPISGDMLQEACQRQEIEVREGDIVLLHAWKGEWGGEGFHECRALADSGVDWLMERKVKTVGIDLSILDDHLDWSRPAHMKLLGHDIPILENLTNLDLLVNKRFTFIGLPLKIKGATGSPIRAVAVTEWY